MLPDRHTTERSRLFRRRATSCAWSASRGRGN